MANLVTDGVRKPVGRDRGETGHSRRQSWGGEVIVSDFLATHYNIWYSKKCHCFNHMPSLQLKTETTTLDMFPTLVDFD